MLADLRAHILADSTVAGLIVERMFPLFLPQNVIYPALSYSEVSGVRDYDLCGPTGRASPRISIHSWSPRYSEARALADAVRRSLNGFSGTMGLDSPGGTQIGHISLDNEFDDFDPEVKVCRVVQDYIVAHFED